MGYEWKRNRMDKYPKIWRKNQKHLNLGRLNLFRKKQVFVGSREEILDILFDLQSSLSPLSLGGWIVWTQSAILLSPHRDGISQWQTLTGDEGMDRLKVVMFPPAPSLPGTMCWLCTCTRGHICCQASSPCNYPPDVPVTIPRGCIFRIKVVIALLLSLPLRYCTFPHWFS